MCAISEGRLRVYSSEIDLLFHSEGNPIEFVSLNGVYEGLSRPDHGRARDVELSLRACIASVFVHGEATLGFRRKCETTEVTWREKKVPRIKSDSNSRLCHVYFNIQLEKYIY